MEWGLDHSARAPHRARYLELTANVGARSASFAVMPCEDGFYTHFLRGDEGLRHYRRYVCRESFGQLCEWWSLDFDRYTTAPLSSEDRERLVSVVARWQGARIC